MSRQLLIRLLLCIFTSTLLLYSHIDKLNDITELKIKIPKLSKEVQILREKNFALALEIEKIESPKSLLEKLREPQYSHLKQLPLSKIIQIGEE